MLPDPDLVPVGEDGRPRGTGKFEKLDADTVIMAVGQQPDTGFLHNITGLRFEDDTLQVDPATLMSDVPGIFAGGDIRSGSMKRVASATGEGASVVSSVHAWLGQ